MFSTQFLCLASPPAEKAEAQDEEDKGGLRWLRRDDWERVEERKGNYGERMAGKGDKEDSGRAMVKKW